MPFESTAHAALRRLFNSGFLVRDIASPMISFDITTDTEIIRNKIVEREIEVVGIRKEGKIVGYVHGEDLDGRPCEKALREFSDEDLVDDDVPLSEIVMGLKERNRLFVRLLGLVGGIVTKSDLLKPPVRMWLFGMITLIEMRFSAMLDRFMPDDTWEEFLSEGRLAKAKQLLEERARRNQHLRLIDCLQFSDKGQILARHEKVREATIFKSRRKFEEMIKKLEQFRNNLAHSQDIIATDWEVIVQLSENMERIVEGHGGVPRRRQCRMPRVHSPR